MRIDWPLIIVLFCVSLPGVFIVMPRLIQFLLPNNSETLKKRASRFVIGQALFMIFVMSLAGALLSPRTGLTDPLLNGLLQGKAELNAFFAILFPVGLYTLLGLVIFCMLYYGVVCSILDERSVEVMSKLRQTLKLDGCMLYGGVAEEVIARWGLMNLIAFFTQVFATQLSKNLVILTALLLSGLMFAVGQIPIYLAAGCVASRRLVYSVVVLSLCQSLLFGFLFWQYGLVAAIVAHMLFHLLWARYDKI